MCVCCFIVFSILFMGTMKHQNSALHLFERFANGKVVGEKALTVEVLREEPQYFTSDILGGTTQNATAKFLGGSSKNIRTSDTGSKREAFANFKNDSSQQNSKPNDKLLDGLLAPGFDEGSCISRHQSYLYRKPLLHRPSQYLISKLRAYEDLHRRCRPHNNAYNKTIRKLIKSKCKHIIWTGSNGLGNRIVSLASAFLFAVLTDRVLFVKFETEMHDLFCEPFLNSSWLLPEDFHYLIQKRRLHNRLLKNNKANNSRESRPSFLYLDLNHDHGELFHCDYSQDFLAEVPALILRSDQYFVPSLFMTPSFEQELNRMFPEKETIFYHLGHYLYHPSNEAWGLISRFYEAYLAKADERIGFQIRIFNTERTPHQTVMEQILACTVKHKLLPEVDEQKSMVSTSRNRSSKAVLVASLYSDYTDCLRTMYWTKPTVNGEIVGVYQPSHEEYQKFKDNKHNMKAWAEIYLLSLCDVLVTSAQSTFGYVAQSLGGLKPWILDKPFNKMTPDPPCQQALSMEPCFHFPPKYNCEGKTKLEVTFLFPSMRPCEDLNWGVKLVSEHDK